MYTCVICQFEVELDDTIAPLPSGRCICLSCYARTTDTAVPMSKKLRSEVAAAAEQATAIDARIVDPV